MKIVIDIDEDTYNGIYRAFDIANKYDCPKPTELSGKLMQAIYDGTPLPKGHGNLIDYDDLIERLDRYGRKKVKYQLPYSPTIIFADREGEE